jgi:hypothetical protein
MFDVCILNIDVDGNIISVTKIVFAPSSPFPSLSRIALRRRVCVRKRRYATQTGIFRTLRFIVHCRSLYHHHRGLFQVRGQSGIQWCRLQHDIHGFTRQSHANMTGSVPLSWHRCFGSDVPPRTGPSSGIPTEHSCLILAAFKVYGNLFQYF